MLDLTSQSSPHWLARAVEDMDLILLDHAHCEKKAASNAIALMFRYPDRPELMLPLSALAREELEHFELVMALMKRREIRYRPLRPSPYAGDLHTAVRKEDPGRLLDMLIASALIEARSCERMKLLSERLEDPELQEFYRSLLACEARHFHGYVDLAYGQFDRQIVRDRLHEMAVHEAAILTRPAGELRLHSAA